MSPECVAPTMCTPALLLLSTPRRKFPSRIVMLPRQRDPECIHIYDACNNAGFALESTRQLVSTSASITLFSPTSSRNLLPSLSAPLCLSRTAVSMMSAIRSTPAVCVALSVVKSGSSMPVDCAQGVTCSRTALVECEGVTVTHLPYPVSFVSCSLCCWGDAKFLLFNEAQLPPSMRLWRCWYEVVRTGSWKERCSCPAAIL